MLNKILYGLKNPKKSIEFVKRQIYLKKIKKEYPFKQKSKKLNIDIQKTKFPSKITSNITYDADKILTGNLKIYSSTNIRVKKEINWHKDYISGFIWPKNKFFNEIQYNYPPGVDIKNPWEISRFQQMITIGMAYKKTGKEKYTKYFINQVNDWIQKNPIYYGINWLCTMEVAIRVCNWLLAYDLMRDSKYLKKNSEFYQIFCGSLYEHEKYIFHNLENMGIKSNHYMSNLVGLIWLGILTSQMKNSQKELKFVLREFEEEVLHQFYNDGVNFEASTSYHRLVLEMVAYTIILCHNYKIKFSQEFYQRINLAFEYSLYYLKPNGLAPQFGDNDSGRFLINKDYFNWKSLNHGNLIDLARNIFPQKKIFKTKPKNYIKYFKNGQILIIKKWDWFLAIIAGGTGQDGNGGHAHNDVGSFELCYKGKDFIIDPGTYVYTSNQSERNKFRSINHHSVFAIKNHEFNQFIKGNLFTLKSSDIPKIKIKKSSKLIQIKIKYFNNQLIRIFKIKPQYLKIIDKIKLQKGQKKLMENIILDNRIHTKIKKNEIILSKNKTDLIIKMNNPKIESIEISKAYNHKMNSEKITNNFNNESEIKIWKK